MADLERGSRGDVGRSSPEGVASVRGPGKHSLTEQLAVQRMAGAAPAGEPAGPGKVSRTEQLPVAGPGGDPAAVHAAAVHGTSGTTQALPHLDAIQRLFGAHDVSGIQAHTDGVARQATEAMGARAFAVGDRVAFAGAPDLHTAAHEAAHVVQQRRGIHLKGGVGQDGDAYEAHADQVADAVVRGESAEPLLDAGAEAGAEPAAHDGAEAGADAEAHAGAEVAGDAEPHAEHASPASAPAAASGAPSVQHKRGLTPVQFERNGKGKRKGKGSSAGRYVRLTFDNASGTVSRVAFTSRPPTNSHRGQGDHIVAYTMLKGAIQTAVKDKTYDNAAAGLSEFITDSKQFVKDAGPNKWWHNAANDLIARLGDVDPSNPSRCKATLIKAVNDAVSLVNSMPGTATKNAKSTGPHGEGSASGGIDHLESQVKKNITVNGNVWTNILGHIDLSAQSGLLADADKLKDKLRWMMTTLRHRAPTTFALLKAPTPLIPDANLDAAVQDKISDATLAGQATLEIRAQLT